jgi:crotonobetainyl-CoA:carnitine CoA-transferase CaiB-like acyl-CoA transferase
VSEAVSELPLDGLRVVDLSHALPGAMATQFLADAGADVLMIEPPGGSPLRSNPAWPALGRCKRSAVIDLHTDGGRTALDNLLADADVLVTTMRPSAARKFGLDAGTLAERHPQLVHVSITGWGTTGPMADRKGYEALVMAKMGFFDTKKKLTARPGPAFVSVPYASWGAAMEAVHGVLAALFERETSGLGQHIDVDLVRGAHAIDTWQWFTDLIGVRWPDAFQVVEAYNDDFEVQAPLAYALLVAPTKDGTWLQFAQVQPRLFAAFMSELGLSEVFTDPKWAGIPVLPTQELRTELWDTMLTKVGERTVEEWQQVFDTDPNIFAERFRHGAEVFEHPQVVHDGRVVTVDDPELGAVRQPSTLVHVDGKPLRPLSPAPRLGADPASFRGEPRLPTATAAKEPSMPLEGVTILDMGMMFAGPFGATMLTDLGARVIKLESLTGDMIRVIQAFPESSGAKVMQGKQSLAVDISTDDGIAIIHELVKGVDVVMQCFRAGAAERAKVDAATLKTLNPDLIYVNAPGYGTSGPYGAKPAYAPSIGAASGMGVVDAPAAAGAMSSTTDVKRAVVQLNAAISVPPLQADGVSALGVASAILLGLVARARGNPISELTATMLGSCMLAIQEHLVDYPGRVEPPIVDDRHHGYGALYRLYETADGWVMLAAPTEADWVALSAALGAGAPVDDARFSMPEGRRQNDGTLADVLGAIFRTRSATEWEELLAKADVGCVKVHEGSPSALLQTDEQLAATYSLMTRGPVYDDYPRLVPYVSFSRSRTQALTFPLVGQDTAAILRELGYSNEQVADLRDRNIVNTC